MLVYARLLLLSRNNFMVEVELKDQQIPVSNFLRDLSGATNSSEVVINWDALGYLAEILPEVIALKGVQQRPDHHLEGDVWTHTLQVLKILNQQQPSASLNLKLAACQTPAHLCAMPFPAWPNTAWPPP